MSKSGAEYAARPDGATAVFANELAARHIGTLVRFRQYDENRETASIWTGELRQLSANGAEVHIIIGNGAELEFTLEHTDRVILHPERTYADVAVFLGNDPQPLALGD
jgi:hypothetical protein